MDTLTAPAPDRRRPRRRGLIALVAVAGLLVLGVGWGFAHAVSTPRSVATPLGPAGPQTGIAAQVSGASARTHLEALQRIADANGGNRASGTPGYRASVDYVVGVLQRAGFDVRTETFTHTGDGDHDDAAPTTDLNVIAQTRTGDPARVVMAGAHLDSVPDGPGINDNGTGVAALLETATAMGGSPNTPNAVRFAFWGGEELGLYGSTAYVAALPPAQRQQIAAYVNLDMLASPNPGFFVLGGVGDAGEEAGPPGSAAVAKVLVEQLAAVGVPAENVRLDGDSDFAAFVEAGIPTGALQSGDKKRKSGEQAARWGGQQGEPFDRCYHKACDTIANVDAVAFDRSVDATAATVLQLATTRT
ncbi:M28 family metallopeptidase [Pseudonocardia sp. CA-107938]|uniref:M28 family metallopeptidase n=1 Tax=Pseudonocardia sp. CA-107938 TaxID=3240021 RepID=UPI003D8ACD6E